MNAEKLKNVLSHLILLIKERADDAASMSEALNDFDAGKAFAYHEVTDFIVECTRVFDVPLKSLGIDELNSDRLL